jgi:hypothetical protein
MWMRGASYPCILHGRAPWRPQTRTQRDRQRCNWALKHALQQWKAQTKSALKKIRGKPQPNASTCVRLK